MTKTREHRKQQKKKKKKKKKNEKKTCHSQRVKTKVQRTPVLDLCANRGGGGGPRGVGDVLGFYGSSSTQN